MAQTNKISPNAGASEEIAGWTDSQFWGWSGDPVNGFTSGY